MCFVVLVTPKILGFGNFFLNPCFCEFETFKSKASASDEEEEEEVPQHPHIIGASHIISGTQGCPLNQYMKRLRMCVSVCVRVRALIIHIHMYVQVQFAVLCVCVCVRARAPEHTPTHTMGAHTHCVLAHCVGARTRSLYTCTRILYQQTTPRC